MFPLRNLVSGGKKYAREHQLVNDVFTNPTTRPASGRCFVGIETKVENQVPLACTEGGGATRVCDGNRAGARVTRSHHIVKHERCKQPLQFVVVLPPRMDTSFSSRNRRMSHAVSSK